MMEESEAVVPGSDANPLPVPEFPPPLQAFKSRSDVEMQVTAERNRRVFTVLSTGVGYAGL
jgi:hypothetical protein